MCKSIDDLLFDYFIKKSKESKKLINNIKIINEGEIQISFINDDYESILGFITDIVPNFEGIDGDIVNSISPIIVLSKDISRELISNVK